MSDDFYAGYSDYKGYTTPDISKKMINRFDQEIWNPAAFTSDMSCLEIGSGTGEFLLYLHHKGLSALTGIDLDPDLQAVQPEAVRDNFRCLNIWDFLNNADGAKFDRIVMLDVIEHFTPEDGCKLLSRLKDLLTDRGKIVLKMPNGESPWGLTYQHGDLTHLTAYNHLSLEQLGKSAGYEIDQIFEQRRGSRRRLFTDAIAHRILNWALLTPPKFWGANLYCILNIRLEGKD